MKKLRLVFVCFAVMLIAAGVAACGDGKGVDPNAVYTVSFDTAGGGTLDPQTVKSGESATRPDSPQKLGWTFDGWYNGDVEYTFTEKVTGDVTLTARYSSVLGGDGTAANPFTIDDAGELSLMAGYIAADSAEFIGAHYVQTADIVVDSDTRSNYAVMAKFDGEYDGRGNKITLSATLFDTLGGTVKNLALVGSITRPADCTFGAGMLANTLDGAVISSVKASGSINGAKGITGGLVGEHKSGRMEYCVSSAAVTGKFAGGLAGMSHGVIANCLATGKIDAADTAGGIAGALRDGALVQNCGFGGAAQGVYAGGIAGDKEGYCDIAVFRCFVFGDGSVKGEHAGAIFGYKTDSDTDYDDTLYCGVRSGFVVEAQADVTVTEGESQVYFFSSLGLPSHVWNTDGNVPSLKEDFGSAPAEVAVTVNGEQSQAAYGSHVGENMFTLDGLHFSSLIELDCDAELYKATPAHEQYAGAFTSGYSEVNFADGGASWRVQKDGDEKSFTYDRIHFHKETFTYTPDFSNPDTAYDVEYDAPVSVYSCDGETYAFMVTKQQIQSGYVAFLESYKKTPSGWTHHASWYPKADGFAGAYTYTTAFSLVSVMKHYVIIDREYTVDNGEGYYLTRYMPKYLDSSSGESLGDGDCVAGRGQTVMFLGDSENNPYKVALAFDVNYEGYVDFIYFADGKLVSSTGSSVTDATADFIGGNWFDGVNKYAFDTATGLVAVTGGGDGKSVPFTVAGGVVSFACDGKTHNLMLAPTEFGAYKLVSCDSDEQFTVATYISDAFDGEWITENGDTIAVSSDPAASVTFNGVGVQAYEAVYNGVQAVYFEAGGKEYYLVAYSTDGVTLLYCDYAAVSAFSADMIQERFVGEFVSAANGERIELSINADLTITLKRGDGETLLGNALPKLVESEGAPEYLLTVSAGDATYGAARKYDSLVLSSDDETLAFTSAEMFARFVGEHTNGAQMLNITATGTFALYKRGETAETYTNLTAEFRDERATYGGENRGFVFGYADGDDKYFFYADADAANVRFYKAWMTENKDGEKSEVVRMENNFIPDEGLDSVYGTYSRMYNGKPDALVFADDGTLTRNYTDENGVEHSDSITWYPILNYNKNTQESKLSAYTYTVDGEGAGFTANIEFTVTGLNWGLTSYSGESEVSKALEPYKGLLFKNSANTKLTVSADRINLTYLTKTTGDSGTTYANSTAGFLFDVMAYENGVLTVEMSENIYGDRSASMELKEEGGKLKVLLTIADGATEEYTGEEVASYRDILGEYVYNGVTYTVTDSELWGNISVKLAFKEGSANRQFSYSVTNDGTVLMSDGRQAFPMRNPANYTYKYVWKDGANLMMSDSLDASLAVAAEDAAIANMPSIDEVKAMLDGNTYTAADGSEISFETTEGIFGTSFQLTDGDLQIFLEEYTRGVGTYTLMFGDYFGTRCVIVHLSDTGITKLLVGETADDATKEYTVPFTYPSTDEMKAAMLDTGYKSADGNTVMFYMNSSMFGESYMIRVNGTEYDFKGCTFADGVYTFSAKSLLGVSKDVLVTYGASGVEKVTVDGVEYLPVTLPTAKELSNLLDGKTFVSDDNAQISFAVSFGSLGITVGDSTEFCDEEGTKDGNVYTYAFGYSWSTQTIAKVTLYPDGTIEKVTIGEVDYLPAE